MITHCRGSDIEKKVPMGRPTKNHRHLTHVCNMCSVLYLAEHNTCTGQLISHLTTCPHCDVTGGRSVTWGSISVSKLVNIIDFLSPAARFGGMRVKLLWMRVRV